MSSSYRSAAAGAALVLVAAEAAAAGWQFDPRIQVGALHDDNYRLTDVRGEEIEVTGAMLDAQLGLVSEYPLGVIELVPRARATVFPDSPDEESNDWFFGAGWQQRLQRLETQVDFEYADESVITSEVVSAEFPDVELGDTVAGDGGRVNVRNRRELLNLQPRLAYRSTPRHRVEAALSVIDATFDRNFVDQRGFTDLSASGGIAIDTSPRDTVSASARVGSYDPAGTRESSDRYGVGGEWSRRWTQKMDTYVRAGVDRTETEVLRRETPTSPLLAVPVSETSWVGGAGAEWTFQVTQVLLDAVRSTSPSSSGAVVIRDELRARLRRSLSPRFALTASLRSVRTEGAIEGATTVGDRDYLTGRAGFEWRMSRQMLVQGAYDYAWQEFEGEPTDATSNQVNVSLVYEPRRKD